MLLTAAGVFGYQVVYIPSVTRCHFPRGFVEGKCQKLKISVKNLLLRVSSSQLTQWTAPCSQMNADEPQQTA
jgi:hypothetical protein